MSPTLFLTCFFLYVLGTIVFGWWMTRRKQSGDDFLLGGRSLPFFLTLGTTIATMVGTGSSMGAVGKGYAGGWAGSLYGIGGALGILVAAWLFAPVRKHCFMTMAEELASYVGANRTVLNLVAVFTFMASVGWLGAHIVGGGAYLHYATGINESWARASIALGFGIYAMIGGYRAVVWTDTLQAVVLFIGFLLTAGAALEIVGGWNGLQGVNAELQSKQSNTSALPHLSLIIVIAVGVLGTPAFRQRIYSGKSVSDVRKAYVTSAGLYLAFAALPAVIGMAAYQSFPNLENQDLAFPSLATSTLPAVLGIVVLLAGLSATLSSASSDAIAGVTTVVRDLYSILFKKMPPPERVVFISRVALAATTGAALVMALTANNVIDYIKMMVSLFLTGMCVVGLLGRVWPRYNAAGAIASLLGASATALLFQFQESWTEYWGNPVIPSLSISIGIGVLVSLVTRPDRISNAQAIEILSNERGQMEN